MDRKSVELSFASLTVVLTLITIIVFIVFGGSVIFYLIAIIAIIVAVLNGWILSNVDNKDFKVPFLIERRIAPKKTRASSAKINKK
jgi:hypothetical protein